MENKYKVEDLEKLFSYTSELQGDEYLSYITSNGFIDLLDVNGSSFFVFIDMVHKRYQYVSPNVKRITGYTLEDFLKNGVSFIIDLYHPEVSLTQKAIHEEVLKVLKTIPPLERTKYKFCYDLRIRHADGHYFKILQQNRFVRLDENGNPALIHSVCHDITEYRPNSLQTFVVYKLENDKETVVYKKDFYPEYENGILTKKEIEVWKYILEGLPSKEIAFKMKISLNTVHTHRKRIYKKLRTRNIVN